MGQRQNNSKRMQRFLHSGTERCARPFTGGDEAGGIYRPYILKTTPPTFDGNTPEFLAFERKFLRYAQRYDSAIARSEEADIQLLDTGVTSEDLPQNALSQQRVRRAQRAWYFS